MNDIEMLQSCGLGIAVANAVTSVKEIADDITDSNNEDGVANYIENTILGSTINRVSLLFTNSN